MPATMTAVADVLSDGGASDLGRSDAFASGTDPALVAGTLRHVFQQLDIEQ